jgi:hypothetical protein
MRVLTFLALGLLAGLAATYLLLRDFGEPFGSVQGPSWLDGVVEPAATRAGTPHAKPAIASRRLAAYRAAAAIADAAALEATLERAVADARTASVELEIDATLARLAELDPAYVRSDPSAALEWLGRFQGQPAYERTLRQIAGVALKMQPITAVVFQAGPFGVASVPSVAMVAWAAAFVLAVLAFAAWQFRRRPL